MDKVNTTHHKNWLDNTLPDKSMPVILGDPPYYGVKGDFDFVWKSFEHYLEDVEKWAIECKRLLADNGTLFWYGDDKNIAYTQVIFDKYFNLQNSLVWYKHNLRGGMFGSTGSESVRSFPICTERLLMYSQDELNLTDCVYHIRDYIRQEIQAAKGEIVFKHVNEALGTATNGGGVASACLSLNKDQPAMITAEMYDRLQSWLGSEFLQKNYDDLRSEYESRRSEYEKTRRAFDNHLRLTDVMEFSQESVTTGNYDHETVKPEKLSRALILTCSRKGDTVLIPFAGSGTECSMALREGRNFYAYDIAEKYVDMTNERVRVQKQNQQQQNLFQ